MERLKAIIIDDEQDSIIALKWELEAFEDQIEVIGSFQNPHEAVKPIKNSHPDIIFLDIKMPEMSGFELLDRVKGHFENVIFITAHNEYAIRAFNVSALDYLLKPVEPELLSNSIDKLKVNHTNNLVEIQLDIMEKLLSGDKKIDKIAVPTLKGLNFIKTSDILYCQSDSNYTMIFTTSNKKIVISKTLKQIELMLKDYSFFRIHHSYLINLIYIEKYLRGNPAYVTIEGGKNIPVSRNRKSDFLDNL